jgi:FAD/FMN-containing dehydrogenase
MAVVRPRNTDEVVAVVRACAAAGQPLVVQGGNTGLVGGSVPAGGEIVLSLARLADLGEIDVTSAQVTVGAGVTLAALQQHARAAGLDFGVDLAARDSATVGGLVATNAGGIRVLRYGSMRAQVVGGEAVLADGSVISRLGGLVKDNTGYDLVSLLCGSEGTLGILTRLRLLLVPRLRARCVALIALPGTAEAVAALPQLRERLPDLAAAELFLADGLALVRGYAGLPAPFAANHPAYLLLECAGGADPTDRLVEAVA